MQDSRIKRLQELICTPRGHSPCLNGRRLFLDEDEVLRPEGVTGPQCRFPGVHYESRGAFAEPCEVFHLMQELDKELSTIKQKKVKQMVETVPERCSNNNGGPHKWKNVLVPPLRSPGTPPILGRPKKQKCQFCSKTRIVPAGTPEGLE